MQQLADMGIIIPDEYRADMRMPGTWQTVSQRQAGDGGPKDDAKQNSRPAGDKKRKHENDEEEEEDSNVHVQRKGWGSRTKSYPKSGQVDDLDALLGAPIQLKSDGVAGEQIDRKTPLSEEGNEVKKEVKREEQDQSLPTSDVGDAVDDKPEAPKMEREVDDAVPSVIFKKRKSKAKDKVPSAADSN
jgi:hypothetical protein